MVSVYVACAQNSSYHFGTVVTHVTFGLVPVAAFLLSSNMPIVDWIRGETIIVVKGDKLLSRLRTFHHHVKIVHGSIIESIGRSVFALYIIKLLSKVCVKKCTETLVMFATRLTLTKLACIVLLHWYVI